jgi:hypothetical protein
MAATSWSEIAAARGKKTGSDMGGRGMAEPPERLRTHQNRVPPENRNA